MSHIVSRIFNKSLVHVFIVISLLMGVGSLLLPGQFNPRVTAAQVLQRSLQLSDSKPGDLANYIISFNLQTAGTLGSIKVEFCSNSSILTEACDPPAGMDVRAAIIDSQSGVSGFIVDPLTTANVLILSRVPVAAGSVPISINLSNIRNSNTVGSQFAKYRTFTSTDASGIEVDSGAVAYSLNDPFAVAAEVPPYLLFCIGNTILGVDCTTTEGLLANMGNFSTTHASSGQTQMVVATNAASGYSLRLSGSSLTSGNNVIPPLNTPTTSAPGNSQFGINLRANTDPNSGEDPAGPGTGTPSSGYSTPNRYKFVSGEVIASGVTVENYRKFTITYLVNISKSQPPGVYSGTFEYSALGNF